MDLVLKLRELRRLREMTQREAGRTSGVGEKTLSSFETGERINSIKVTQLLALLSIFGVTPAEFFGDGVERKLLAELERLTPAELRIVTGLRDLPDVTRERLVDRFIVMLEAVQATGEPHFRVVR